MKRFAVFGYGYNPSIPTCFVFATALAEAWEKARAALHRKALVSNVIESDDF